MSPAAPPAAVRFGNYHLLAHLATGGMADIFLARMSGAEGFEKLVVVKMLLEKLGGEPEYVNMFLDEARLNAQLSHSNVVQCIDLGRAEGRYYMTMEYVSGLSLAQVGRLATQRLGAVPQEVATGTLVQAAAGLHYAHERRDSDGTAMGIIHRDVSPQNLIVTTEGIVKLVDFGIAKHAGRATKTRAGVVKGKFAYMSPEQCVGDPIDRRSDIFSLGIVMFELATSRRLFKRETTYATYDAIATCDVPDPRLVNPEIADEVAAVIRVALAKRPQDRYQTAEEMQEAIEHAMRRAGLRAPSSWLASFLEETFEPEVTAQRAMIGRAESGELAAAIQQRGEAGTSELEISDLEAEPEPEDELTAVYTGGGGEMDLPEETVLDEPPPQTRPPPRPAHGSELARSRRHDSEPARPRREPGEPGHIAPPDPARQIVLPRESRESRDETTPRPHALEPAYTQPAVVYTPPPPQHLYQPPPVYGAPTGGSSPAGGFATPPYVPSVATARGQPFPWFLVIAGSIVFATVVGVLIVLLLS